ncbi:MAG TPA: Sua5/YciO/YrdC/YwlC family protein [Candidatus Acidoferrales bacterium]|nr:Sua5/YciO/YrdC/YwlC family protein [Candidatus Acidoferrales bacterium]
MPAIDARVEPRERVVEASAATIFAGGTLVLPGDTNYWLACDPYRTNAVERIRQTKGRANGEPLLLLVPSATEFLEYTAGNSLAVSAAKRFLPGPVTLIVRKPAFVGDHVTAGLSTLAIRVPQSDLTRAILERTGPLAAMRAGSREPACADLVIENGAPPCEGESSIVDLTEPTLRVRSL